MVRYILAIDSAGPISYFALRNLDDSTDVQAASLDHEARAEGLILGINRLVADASCELTAIKEVVVATGPGSFTGVRSGIATAMGIADALGVSCLGVNNLFSRAVGELGVDGIVVPVAPANKRELFFAAYEVQNGGGTITELFQPTVCLAGALFDSLDNLDRGGNSPPCLIADVSLTHWGFETLVEAHREKSLHFKQIRAEHPAVLLGNAVALLRSHPGLDRLISLEPRYVKGVNAQTLSERGIFKASPLEEKAE